MTERTRRRRDDVLLALAALAIGLAIAGGYAAWRAVSLEEASGSARWREFGDALLLPGALIVVAVAAMVWFGWKANID
jgi:hypothetical protein